MNEEKILTKHPHGKNGRNINKQTYNLFKDVLLKILSNYELTHGELMKQINLKLKDKFSGSINWYAETVKLDLEARKMIERIDSKPQKYRLKQ